MTKRKSILTRRPRKYQGEGLKQFRKDVAKLKKLGLTGTKIEPRKQKPTSYYIKKVNALKPVIEGRAQLVEASKPQRDIYRENAGYKTYSKYIIVDKEKPEQTAEMQGDYLNIKVPMERGQMEYIVFPVKAADLGQFVEKIKDDETLNNLKAPTDQFGFRLFGHNSRRGFPDVEDMAFYINTQYRHLLDKNNASREAFRHLTLLRFSGRENELPDSGEPKFIHRAPRENGRSDFYPNKRVADRIRKKYRTTKAKQRENETAEQRAARLAYQRDYYHKTKG